LLVPTSWVAKVKLVGKRVASGPEITPVPLRLTLWGLPVALSLTVTVPVRLPVVAGLKTTLNVQLAPAASVLVQVAPGPKKKLPAVWVMLMIVNVAVPVFFSVTTCAALAVTTLCFRKLNAVGA